MVCENPGYEGREAVDWQSATPSVLKGATTVNTHTNFGSYLHSFDSGVSLFDLKVKN